MSLQFHVGNPLYSELSRTMRGVNAQLMAALNARSGTFNLHGQTHVRQSDGKIEDSLIDHVRTNDLFGDGHGYVFALDRVTEVAASEEFAQARQQLDSGAEEARLAIGDEEWTACKNSQSGDYTLNKSSNGLPFRNSVTLSPDGGRAVVQLSGAGYGASFSQTLYGESNGSGALACLDETLLVTEH